MPGAHVCIRCGWGHRCDVSSTGPMRCEPRLSPIITVLLPSCGLLLVILLLSPSHCLMSLSARSQVMEDGAALQTGGHQAQAQSSDGEPVLAPEEEHPAETESDVLEE